MVELVVPVPVELLTMHAALPEIISQRNVLTVTGIPPAAFLRMLRDPAFPLDVIKQGKLRLVDRETFVTWLKAQGQRVSAATQEAPAVDPRLAKAGFVRRAGKSRG